MPEGSRAGKGGGAVLPQEQKGRITARTSQLGIGFRGFRIGLDVFATKRPVLVSRRATRSAWRGKALSKRLLLPRNMELPLSQTLKFSGYTHSDTNEVVCVDPSTGRGSGGLRQRNVLAVTLTRARLPGARRGAQRGRVSPATIAPPTSPNMRPPPARRRERSGFASSMPAWTPKDGGTDVARPGFAAEESGRNRARGRLASWPLSRRPR